jgi:hypothetical protein
VLVRFRFGGTNFSVKEKDEASPLRECAMGFVELPSFSDLPGSEGFLLAAAAVFLPGNGSGAACCLSTARRHDLQASALVSQYQPVRPKFRADAIGRSANETQQ